MITALGTAYSSNTLRTRWFVGTGGQLSLTEVYRRVGNGHAWCIVSAKLHKVKS